MAAHVNLIGNKRDYFHEKDAVPTIAVPAIIFHGDQDATVHPRNGEQVSEPS